MEQNVELIKNKKRAFVAILLSVSIMLVMVLYNFSGVSYALRNNKITFWRAEGTEVMKVCTSDVNGKLTEECLQEIAKVCSKWSLDKCQHSGCDGDNQSNPKTVSQLGEMTFENDTNYYCKGGSSQSGYNKGCYICRTDSSIVKWGFSTEGDTKCPGGYTKDSSKTEEECVVNACYVCKTDETVVKWDTSDISDDNCPSGYNKTTKTESECVYVEPEPEPACYVCSTNEKILKWDTDGDADDSCSSGYTKTTKSETECVYVEPEPEPACYICSTNEKILKWDTDGDADDSCSSGYTKTTKSEPECIYVEPEPACYVCSTDESVLKWDTNGNSDDKCSKGYNKTTKSESECVYVENPKTGSYEYIYISLLLIFTFVLLFVEFSQRKNVIE